MRDRPRYYYSTRTAALPFTLPLLPQCTAVYEADTRSRSVGRAEEACVLATSEIPMSDSVHLRTRHYGASS